MKKICITCSILLMLFCLTACYSSSDINSTPYISDDASSYNNTNAESSLVEEKQGNTSTIAYSECVECGRICGTGHSYCDTHECWESDCLMPRKSMGNYCVNHSCLLCESSRTSSSSPYCFSHKCNSCDNVVVDGSRYCIAHKCLMCNDKNLGTSQYCGFHRPD